MERVATDIHVTQAAIRAEITQLREILSHELEKIAALEQHLTKGPRKPLDPGIMDLCLPEK